MSEESLLEAESTLKKSLRTAGKHWRDCVLITCLLVTVANLVLLSFVSTNLQSQSKPAHDLLGKFRSVYYDFANQQHQLGRIIPQMVYFFNTYVPKSERFMSSIDSCVTSIGVCS